MPLTNADFSEAALIEFHGFDDMPCSGGNGDKATAILTRWNSLVPEGEFPYPYLKMNEPFPKATPTNSRSYHIQDVNWIPWTMRR
jgi:hypothetical protein